MKLAKLSLAAILAAGTFSVANATSLQDAIQGVTLNGFLRIRYYNRSYNVGNTYNRWRTNGVFVFGVPIGDNLKMVYRSSVQTNVFTDDDQVLGGTTLIDDYIHNDYLYMSYSNGPVNAIVGKIPVMTPVTSSDPASPGHGAGAIASYNVGNGLTLAGAYVDALTNEGFTVGNTVYAAAAIYNSDMFSGQAWYFHATNLIKNLYTLQATVKPIAGLTLHGDFASSKLDDAVEENADNKTYFNISAKYAANGFCGKIGYASTNDKDGIIDLSGATDWGDAPIAAVLPVANRYNIANLTDTDAYYAKLGYNVNAKTKIYAAYAKVDQSKEAGDNDSDEYKIGADYAYNKKLGFHIYYDVLDYDKDKAVYNGAEKDWHTWNEFRFEARYNF